MTLVDIREAVAQLRSRNAKPYPDSYYVGIAHPKALAGLAADSNWVNWNAYAGAVEKMYKGEIGKAEGVRWVADSNCYCPKINAIYSSINAVTGRYYMNYIFGPQCYGVTELVGEKAMQFKRVSNAPDKADPLGLYQTVGYRLLIGAGVLNPSAGLILVSGKNEA